jgi:L-lactate dehydrogenase
MSRVSVIGAGSVGTACCMAIVAEKRCSELVVFDVNRQALEGEVLDLQHAGAFHHVAVRAAATLEETYGSDVVVITAGARQRPGESRLALHARNRAIMESVVPPVVAASPGCVVIVVSNPCDVMTKIAADCAGLPAGRVFGSGTYLDSSRFRSFAGVYMSCDAGHIHAMVIGEHGDSSVLLESTATCGGASLSSLIPAFKLREMHARVVSSAQEIICKKGFTCTGIGFTVSRLVDHVLRGNGAVVPVSVPVKGRFGIEDDVYLSVPCIVGRRGAKALDIEVREEEAEAMRESARRVAECLAAGGDDDGDDA